MSDDNNKDDLERQEKQPDPPQKPDPEEERRNRTNMWAASQFAYTLVTVSVVFGFIGHWLGSLLGGGLWSMFGMLILGGLGFGLETWRMIRTFSNYGKKPKSKDDDDKSSRR